MLEEPSPNQSQSPRAIKPGVQTTEFWVAITLIVLDAVLAACEVIPAEWAATLATVTGTVYKLVRAIAKSTPEGSAR